MSNESEQTSLERTEAFHAFLNLAPGATATIIAPTLGDLAEYVGRLRPVASVTKRATTPRGTTSDAAPPAAANEGKAGNAPASTGTQASAPPADSGSAANAGDKDPFEIPDAELIKQVGARVNALAAISRETIVGELKKFGVSRGGELTREQQLKFLADTKHLVKG